MDKYDILALLWDYKYTEPANVSNIVVLPMTLLQLAVLLPLILPVAAAVPGVILSLV